MKDDHYRSLLGKRKTALTAVQDSGQAAAGTVELDQSRVGRLSRMDAMQSQAMHLEADRRRVLEMLSLIHISEPTRPPLLSRMPSSA